MTNDESELIGRSGSYQKGVARRQEILDRAIEVFAERGADGTSLRQIAKEIGVSHAALLHYFDSREQLLVAVYEHAERVRSERTGLRSIEDPVGMLVEAATHNVAVPGLVQLYSTLVAAALESRNEVSRNFFTERFEVTRRELAGLIARDQDRGLIRKDVDASAIASLLIAASDGLQTQWLLDPNVDLRGFLQLFDILLTPAVQPQGSRAD
ncbi:TetR/AcrR family transcriptional regulator [Paeniglutamicibacter sp. NPDC012692]|uniref:TetR/AcrR family transcriptional regulator n=1 Tax=Paeniglutamicibacter sp. NPDC012692 TaxID=3364388 RepID=UPI00368AFE7A